MTIKEPDEIHSVIGCARCGEDHDDLPFYLFDRPPERGETETYTYRYKWWATCPTTCDPILMVLQDLK
jgi:hypothetical protein